ncbi:MAG: Carboxy-terminal processing protease CtpB [Firmicutes bacterium]|nr:Carboxy-terminal processing protease CtpB [Bacillota bacterium]
MELREEEKKTVSRVSLPKVVALCLAFLVVGLFLGATSQFIMGPVGATILSRLGLPVDPNVARLLAVRNLVLDTHLNPKLDPNEMMENAVRGLLSRVDGGLTRYENPKEARRTAERAAGEFTGIGVTVRMVDEQVQIESVFRGAPAQGAGLLPRDVIVAVDDQTLRGLTLHEVTDRIKGAAGTNVTLTVFRPALGRTMNVTITRARIVVPVVSYEIVEPQIAHVILTQFTTTATEQMRQTLATLEQQGIKHLLLDLRFNPGGFTHVAEDVASFFLGPKHVVYQTVDREGAVRQTITRGQRIYTGRISVLINQGSASASELLTGALRDHLGSTVLGVTSFGKGTIQQGYPLGDGSRVWITVRGYKTPAGTVIDAKGINADIIIEQPDPASPEDVQLARALQHIRTYLLR